MCGTEPTPNRHSIKGVRSQYFDWSCIVFIFLYTVFSLLNVISIIRYALTLLMLQASRLYRSARGISFKIIPLVLSRCVMRCINPFKLTKKTKN